MQARFQTGPQVLQAIRERIGELDIGSRAGFLNVIAADADAVELGHLGSGISEDIGDDSHRLAGRIDVGIAHHIFFEDVILNRARELGWRDALFLGGDVVEGEHRQDRAVHCHRDRHLIKRDAVEERFHIEYAVDGDARHADITHNPRMIGVVAAMRGEVEGYRQSFLTGGKVAAVEGVALLGGGVTGVLPYRPGP